LPSVVVEARVGSDPDSDWTVVCRASCDRDLPLAYEYRINGSNVRTSEPFRLQAQPGQRLTLEVNASSESAHSVGIVLVAASPILLATGFFYVVAGSLGGAVGCDPGQTCNGNSTATTGGAVLMGTGLVALIAGIALIASNGSTTERFVPGSF